MKWLLQKNIWNEYNYERFIQSIEHANIEFEEVHVIPFTESFDVEIDFIPTHIFGSNRFVNICRSRGYPTYKSFDPIESKIYNDPDLWINSDCLYTYWNSIVKNEFIKTPSFIKPMTEKFFTGCVVTPDLPIEDQVQLATSFIEEPLFELIQVTSVKTIISEVRFYIIGGKIISASQYKYRGNVKHFRIDKEHAAWMKCQDILNKFGAIDEAFVMDLGLVDEDWRIVELNNINSSGLYDTDTDAIVNAFKHL